MKKQFRFLSVLIALIVLLGSLSSSGLSFAQDDENIQALEESVLELNHKLAEDDLESQMQMNQKDEDSGSDIAGSEEKVNLKIYKNVVTLNHENIHDDDQLFEFKIYIKKDNGDWHWVSTALINGTGENTITGIKAGEYKVEEIPIPEGYFLWEEGSEQNKSKIIEPGQSAEFNFINKKSDKLPTGKGKITVHKRIKRASGSVDANLGNREFTIRLTGPNGYDKELIINKHGNTGDHVIFENLPAGTYTIDETNINSDIDFDGFYISHNGNNGEAKGNTLKIKGNGNNNVWLINKEESKSDPDEPEDKGKLKITKKVVDLNNELVSDDDGQFSFIIFKWNEEKDKWEQVSDRKYITGNGEVDFEGLEEGKYKVTEGFLTYEYIKVSGDGEYNVANNNTTTAEFINKKRDFSNWKANIKVIKTFEGFGNNLPDLDSVEFELWKDGIKVDGPTAIDQDGYVKFNNLPVGIYEVKEVYNSEYIPEFIDDAVVELHPKYQAGVWHVEVVNHPREDETTPEWSKGKIMLWKLKWAGKFGLPAGGIKFTLENENGDITELETNLLGFLMFDNLPEGIYTLKEIVPNNYTSSLPDEGKEITINKNKHKGIVTITVNNHKKPREPKWTGTIIIKKEILSTGIAIRPSGFEFELWKDGALFKESLPTDNSGQIDFTGLEPGTYVIKEKHKDGFEAEFPNGSSIEYEITIGPENEVDNTWVVKVINHIIDKEDWKGTIRIIKSIGGNHPSVPDPSGFEFELWKDGVLIKESLPTGISGEIDFTGLEEGSYVIKEKHDDDYEAQFPDGSSVEYEIEIGPDNENDNVWIVRVVNNPKDKEWLGTLVIQKYISGSSEEFNYSGFEFELWLDGVKVAGPETTDASGQAIFRDLPSGTYEIRETNSKGYIPMGGFEVEMSEENAYGDNIIYHTFENAPREEVWLGKLVIQKYISGTMDEDLSGFEFELWQNGVKVAGPETTDALGQATFENLPAGIYEIRETNTKGYLAVGGFVVEVSKEAAKGDNLVWHTFENQKIPREDIIVRKIVNGDSNLSGFTFKLYRKTDSGEIHILDLTTDDSGLVKFENMEYGEYILYEANKAGYIMGIGDYGSGQGLEFNHSTEGDSAITITNTKERIPPNEGKIEVVKKVVNSSGNSISSSEFFYFELYKLVDGVWLRLEIKDIRGNGSVVFDVDYDVEGIYRVREVNIPRGYTLISSNNLEVLVSGKVEFTNELDDPYDTPQDGDDPNDTPLDNDRPYDTPEEDDPKKEPEKPDENEEIVEETPESVPDKEDEEVKDDKIVKEEEEVVKEEVPQSKPVTLPRTGAASPYVASGFGALLLAIGIFLRKFRKR